MRRLLEMIATVKNQKALPMLLHGFDFNKNSLADKSFSTDMFWHFIEECQPFVFAPKNKAPVELDGKAIFDIENDDNYVPPEVASPFKIWSAEMSGDNYITVPHEQSDDGPLADHEKVSIISFIAVEQKAGDHVYFIYVETPLGDGRKQRIVAVTTEMDVVAAELVKRLYAEKTGIESGRTKIKIGTGSTKRHVKLRKVIHIKPKRVVANEIKAGTSDKTIDWTHRWTVRGHYRNLPEGKIGKDRDGNYCVPNKTWVIESIKGPEDMPIIKKTRILENEVLIEKPNSDWDSKES